MRVNIEDENNIPRLLEALEELSRKSIQIGIFGEDDSQILMIARVNEFGAHIEPKSAKYLTIPLNKKAREKSPRDFSDLFPIKANGGLYLVKKKGKKNLEFYYWLAESVDIPERSFIRGGYDEYRNKIERKGEILLKKVLSFKITVDKFFETLGEYIVGRIVKYMTDLKAPPKSSVTLSTDKRKTNPLIKTGRLKSSITYKVVEI
ncbi:hypothetical protein [Dethiothermospora halolimnae]|uniref:hypothetical protein n=1 Tax=Dethiothermospora halolimnae TaxID=3114390 RepID=UPI003CCB94D6